ncbi:MAG: thioredoxin domain-containing protein [Jatrophihabitans sp.]
MPNRLGASTSPYLLQHADNPVDWWEWGDEAFAEARRRDVPVLLSVGYAACHWCHVMAHESFEDEPTAALMNAGFVNVKVDREERPDVDAVYMEATQALTGQGGWPMTCLLTPDGAPFFAGTYLPRTQLHSLLDAAGEAWRDRRDELTESGQRVIAALARKETPEHPLPTGADLAAAMQVLRSQFDEKHGGFGGAPKFPPSMVLEFLLRHHERAGDADALRLAERTFEAMARGGMYDQLAGGFARYSVDNQWVVPHFEKMLYDNALLLRGYLHWWRVTGSPLAERIVRETATFLLDELRTPEGGFASALDADTDGVEGLTYVWTPQQLEAVLGPADGAIAAGMFEVTAAGTFEAGASTLQLLADPGDPEQWAELRTRLHEARATRPQPARDDKVVTAWNALAIAALAEAGVVLAEPEYVAAAVEAAELLLDRHWLDGRLRRSSRGGAVGAPLGVLEDYANLADGLLVLHQATGQPRWLNAAGDLLAVAVDIFIDDDGTVWDTAADASPLVRRPWDPTDGATPSGSSALAGALLNYSALSGSEGHRETAERLLTVVSWLGREQPRFLGHALAAAEALVDGPVQVAIVGESGSGVLTETAWLHRGPGAVVVSGDPDAPGMPLLAQRPARTDGGLAYVCRGMVCDAPVGIVEELRRALAHA